MPNRSIPNRDYRRLQHMLDASQAAVSFLAEKSRENFETERLLFNGVVRELEVLGEAAAQITSASKNHFSNLPWKKMISMRNFLIHTYFEINKQTVWLAVKESLPLDLALQDVEQEVALGSESKL